eukprot:276804_1
MEDEKKNISSNIDLHVTIDETSPYNGAVRYPCAVSVGSGSILVFGGYDNMNQNKRCSIPNVWFYNVIINQYVQMKPLPYGVEGPSAAITPDGDGVVVVGGNGSKMVVYTPNTTKEDHEIHEILYKIGTGASIVFDNNNNLHILGGHENKGMQHLLIKWDQNKLLKDREIINLGNTPNSCYYSGVCHYKNKIYVMGSYYEKKDAFWIYDIKNQTWKNGPNMPLKKSGVGCHLINDNKDIILIGDGYGGKDSDIILLYNIETNKWRISETKLKHNIGFHASALLAERCEIHGFSGCSGDRNVDTHFVVKYHSTLN